MAAFEIRTDLALENTEKFKRDNVEIKGVEIHETYQEDLELTETVVKIVDAHGAKAMGKPEGTYITMESPYLLGNNKEIHKKISQALSEHLQQVLGKANRKSMLVIGLGNSDITPDALGPIAVSHLQINRHLTEQKENQKEQNVLSSLTPGVMAQTGMETMEIVRGVVKETKPDVILVVDALAARSMYRVNRTIQITDTGINPGSGVQNHRAGLNQETIGVPVIAIGVPTVVDAAAIVYDAVADLLDEGQAEDVMEEVFSQDLHQMFVTPKDVDEAVQTLGTTIAEGINMMVEGQSMYKLVV